MSLNESQIQAIENYGDRIETIKDFMTAVRKLPGMYIGFVGTRGFVTMCREIFQNSIDQILDPQSPGNWFSFKIDERTLQVEVIDNGLSLPYDDMIRILTKEHTSKNYHRKKGEYGTGLHGIGSKAVNALSEEFTVTAYHYDGTAKYARFSCGKVVECPKDVPNKDKFQGVKFTFIPDLDIMGEIDVRWKDLYVLIKRMISLCPIGTKMDFYAIDKNGKEFEEHIVNKDGIMTNIIESVHKPIIAPIYCTGDDGTHYLEVAFCFDAGGEEGPLDRELVTSFANFCPTRGGSHVDGTIEGICRWFTTYMNNIYLSNQKAKDKLKVIANDIKNGLNVMVSAAHIEPVFSSQGKDVLSNADMIPFCKEVTMKGLDEWSKSNPNDLAKICKFFKDLAELRMKNDKSKAKIATKYKADTLSGLPRKYVKPLGKKNIELIIVEGDKLLHCL
jgi:DNA gyrase/topoisomerase IV subunit B